MEFQMTVAGENYCFTSLNRDAFLVAGPRSEYILYRHSSKWRCADEIEKTLLAKLAAVLDEHLAVAH